MPKFSQSSLDQLATCHPKLQELFNEVIKYIECRVLEGHRGQVAQDKAFAEGHSKLKWPNGNHNKTPSVAVDVVPSSAGDLDKFKLDWKDIKKFYYFAGLVLGVASQMKITIRYGGDWDVDNDLNDNKFADLVHFELKG